MAQQDEVTELLVRWSEGDDRALDHLLPLVYADLRGIARRHLGRERPEHSLAPTALVHEAYLRLVDQRRATWQNRAHFLGLASQLMRRVLVDHARARNARKRGGSATFVTLEEGMDKQQDGAAADVLAIDAALERLALIDPEHARIVELRFFAGLTVDETAHVLKRSPRTVKREWRLAKAWLHRELRPAR